MDFSLKYLKLLPSTEIGIVGVSAFASKLPKSIVFQKKVGQRFRIGERRSRPTQHGNSLSSSAVRIMFRPMRPKPLIPTLMGSASEGMSAKTGQGCPGPYIMRRATLQTSARCETKMLWLRNKSQRRAELAKN